MNNSTTSNVAAVIVPSAIQISFGAVAIISNLIIFLVLLCNTTYLKKSAFIVGMAMGDLLDGVALTINGSFKIQRVFDGTTSLMVHPTYCMKLFVIPSYLLGNQISSVMFLLTGVERFLAIKYYDWYYLKWSNKTAWLATSSAYLYCIVSWSSAVVISASYDASYTISILCTVPAITNTNYTSYNYCISIVGGTVAVAGSLVAMVLFTKKKIRVKSTSDVSTTTKNHVRKQWNLTRLTLCLATLDLGLVVTPTFLSLVVSNDTTSTMRSWSLQMLCLRSFLNLIVYLFANSDFRAAALKTCRLNIANPGQQISVPSRGTASSTNAVALTKM